MSPQSETPTDTLDRPPLVEKNDSFGEGDKSSRPPIRQDIEILRILSAFGIVWFHSGFDRTGIGYGGLAVFLILSAYLATIRAKAPQPIRQILSQRSQRLLIPWAFWMVAYGFRNFLVDRNLLETDRGWINGLLAGTQIHLWYLPFLFFATIGIDLTIPRLRREWLGPACALGSITLLVTAPAWRAWSDLHGYPTVQYCHALLGLLLGIFLACAKNLPVLWVRLGLGAIALALISALAREVVGVGICYSVGFALCAWILIWPPQLPKAWDVRKISGCMLGVYLIHIIFDRLYIEHTHLPKLVQPWATFASALLVTWLLRRFAPKLARWVV